MARRFVAALFLFMMSFLCLASGKFYVVSVGVADYPGTENDLRLPVADAKSVASIYKLCENATVLLFTDGKATRKDIVDNTKALFARAKKEDVVIFFFSGHGYKGGYVVYDDMLEYDELREIFHNCKAGSKILFVDACKSGSMRQNGMAETDPGADVMLFLSCRADEYSIETGSMINGYFTACLVRALKGGADEDGNRVITAKELFKAVSRSVAQMSKDRQHPVMWGNFNDNMSVINWN